MRWFRRLVETYREHRRKRRQASAASNSNGSAPGQTRVPLSQDYHEPIANPTLAPASASLSIAPDSGPSVLPDSTRSSRANPHIAFTRASSATASSSARYDPGTSRHNSLPAPYAERTGTASTNATAVSRRSVFTLRSIASARLRRGSRASQEALKPQFISAYNLRWTALHAWLVGTFGENFQGSENWFVKDAEHGTWKVLCPQLTEEQREEIDTLRTDRRP